MPAGVSLFTYVKFATASLLSMFAGSQLVYNYYRPLEDLEEFIRKSEGKQISEADIKDLLSPASKGL